MSLVVLLGPQRFRPTLADAFRHVGAEGPVAAVTAGWEEREDEIDELSAHLGCDVVNLRLHGRAEHIFTRDSEFLEAWRVRRALLRERRVIYRDRLRSLVDALHRLDQMKQSDLVVDERRDALEAIRRLDSRQEELAAGLHAEFEDTWKPMERDSVRLQVERVRELVADCGAVAFAGGNVAVLRNRLRLFGVDEMIGDRPLFAWSAGAMCATERIVIYHDNPPQGARNAIVMERGLGLCPDVIALPHARSRMHLDDPARVALFAQRFAPQPAVALDDASGLIWQDGAWHLFGDGARRLRTNGTVTEMVEFQVPA